MKQLEGFFTKKQPKIKTKNHINQKTKKPKTKNQKPKTKNQKPKAKSQKPQAITDPNQNLIKILTPKPKIERGKSLQDKLLATETDQKRLEETLKSLEETVKNRASTDQDRRHGFVIILFYLFLLASL